MPNSFGQQVHSSLNDPKNLKRILAVFLGLSLCLGGYFLGNSLGWWGAAPDDPETPVSPTSCEINIENYRTGAAYASADHQIYIYAASTIGKTDAEIADLEFASFTQVTTGDSGLSFTPQENKVYKGKVNGSDIVELWFTPILGENNLRVMNLTEDTAMVSFANPQMSTTINRTDYRDWDIQIQTLDAAEGASADATDEEGYLPYHDFANDVYMRFVIRIEFNTTASLSWGEYRGSENTNEKASGNYLYYEIDVAIYGSMTFEFRAGSGIGSTFELVGMAIGYGNAESFTAWDSQN